MRICTLCILVLALSATALGATTYDLEIDGGAAIYLAGRTDIPVPDEDDPWTFLLRHSEPFADETLETHPPCIPVVGGNRISVVSASGGIDFFNDPSAIFFPPDGNGDSGSNLDAIDGLSGYIGPEGPLAGVFLDDSIPDGTAPATLDFRPVGDGGLGTDFLSLSPELGQVFYIGDGLTSLAETQYFMAPAGATRLCIGIPDGWAFDNHPGYYDDNNGSYLVELSVEEERCETAYAYDGGAMCFIDLGFKNWGWTIQLTEATEYEFDVYAAAGQCDTTKGILVGTVIVEIDYASDTVNVTYDMDEGFTVEEVHLYIGDEEVPRNKKGKPTVSPGQYYAVPDLYPGQYLIAHAVVCWYE